MIHIAIQPPTDSQPNSRRGSQHPGDSQQKSLPRTPTQESAQLPPGAKGGKGKARADEGVIPGSPMRSAPAQAPPSPARTPRQTPSAMPQDLPTTPRQRTVAPSASASGVKSPVVNSVHPSGVALPESMAGETYISGTTRTPTQGSVPLDKAESQRSPTIRAASPKPPTRQARSQSQSQGRAPSHAPSQAPSQAPTQAARSKAPSYAPSRVDTATIPSQALPSPRAPSQQMSMAPSKAGTQRTGAGPGQAPSQQPMRASQAAPSASGQTHHTHHTHVQTQNLAQGQGQSRSATPSRVARAPSDEDVRTVRGGTSTPTPGYPGPSPYPQSQQQQPSRGPTPQLQQQQQRQAPSAQHYDDDEDRQFTEAELVEILRTPRTVQTISPSVLAAEVNRSHFHDEDLCILLHAADDEYTHEVVKKAIRKAVKARLKKLGYEHESEFLREINGPGHGNGHGHSHGQIGNGKARPQAAITAGSSRGTGPPPSDPPEWALGLIEMVNHAHQRLDSLHYKFDHRVPSETDNHDGHEVHDETAASEAIHDYEPDTSQKIVPIETRPVSGHAQEYYNGGHHDDYDEEEEHFHQETPGEDHLQPSEYDEETYRMRVKQPAGSEASHRTWEIEKSGGDPANRTMALDAIPEITGFDENSVYYADDPTHRRDQGRAVASPLAPGLHVDALATGPSHQPHQPAQPWPSTEWQLAQTSPPPWQRVHQKLLGWAMIWPLSEFDNGLASTAPGNQIDEVALSIYLTQVYKRYVRSRHTDNPPARVDRLFVPPNIADAISNAVFNGRHGDACQMLRDMWTPFGLDGMPRLLIVLAKHRRDSNHYVVHRFSLPEGTLTTYDTHPERAAPDGRPLGWWFAIRAAWPHAMYPHPDHLVQKMVRFHRPHQPLSDNSVAAVAIWRNLIMGSRAERSTDLVRLRELINNEVKSLRQRKEMGRLSVTATKSGWEATA
ncbi:hypothetical protein BOTBODRAFT_217466 [Botryobasidium botryosum FD-172 SS1]|uniref:Uncharacterized protein n=1 Tax=Botryobasidium botryosum (strain FD-172 SS1) TaxID=930990 RepID=A0A067NDT6_BOTB1|nr:hypothetical protein BOTBODRAFT_217466 [Botryobasidium botryosum FD-172 SS1]